PDDSFDRIVAINVAYFWDDAETVVAELRRVLRPDGILGVYCTLARHLDSIGLGSSGTHRLWNAADMAILLGHDTCIHKVDAAPDIRGFIAISRLHESKMPSSTRR
ncbi:MAG: methyltransferase domain-containing protein, partial [Oxalobacteraceae bacterium]